MQVSGLSTYDDDGQVPVIQKDLHAFLASRQNLYGIYKQKINMRNNAE